ncbi:hypothetical protein [Nocardia sp. NPDC057668]|uniref:hypothetical protein n=1 Tax=Nocardia sp. NPDC057668 TaxID=3346202 RepID=UPI00366DC8B0
MAARMRDDDLNPRRLFGLLFAAASDLGYTILPVGPDEIMVSDNDSMTTLTLEHIRRRLLFEPADHWPAIVSDHLGTVVAATAVDRDAPLDVHSFPAMRALLRTRVYPAAAAARNLVWREWAPGLIQRLLIDKVHTVMPVERAWTHEWPPDTELFTLAENNVRADGDVSLAPLPLGDFDALATNLPIFRMAGSEYLTTNLRWLDDYPVVGPAGALFTAPARQRVYCHPITDLEVLRALLVLARFGTLVYETDPWPISPWLYHWHEGRIDLAATTNHVNNQGEVTPTPVFETFLGTLGRTTDS